MPNHRRKPPREFRSRFFEPHRDTYLSTLARLIDFEKKRHPSLLDVIEIPAEETLQGEELFTKFGYPDYRHRTFKFDDESYNRDPGDLGGFIAVAQRNDEAPRTLCFLRRPAGIDAEEYAVNYIAIFLHEMGHVHDLETAGIDLETERHVVETEHIAHVYAIDQLFNLKLWRPAAIFLMMLQDLARVSERLSLREAAGRILQRPDVINFLNQISAEKKPSFEFSNSPTLSSAAPLDLNVRIPDKAEMLKRFLRDRMNMAPDLDDV